MCPPWHEGGGGRGPLPAANGPLAAWWSETCWGVVVWLPGHRRGSPPWWVVEEYGSGPGSGKPSWRCSRPVASTGPERFCESSVSRGGRSPQAGDVRSIPGAEVRKDSTAGSEYIPR